MRQETWLPTLKYSPGPGAAIFSARETGARALRKRTRRRDCYDTAARQVTGRVETRLFFYKKQTQMFK